MAGAGCWGGSQGARRHGVAPTTRGATCPSASRSPAVTTSRRSTSDVPALRFPRGARGRDVAGAGCRSPPPGAAVSTGAAGGGERFARPRRAADERPRRRGLGFLIAVVVVLLFLASRIATFYTDVLWFDRIGFVGVLWRQLGAQLAVGTVSALVVTAVLVGNLLLARRLAPPYRIPTAQEAVVERYRELVVPFARPVLIGIGVLVGVLTGLTMAANWETVLLWLNGGDFGRDDPHFGRDIGWFVFSLPLYRLLNSSLSTILTFTLLLTAAAHYLFGGIRPQAPAQRVTPAANVHLSLLLAVFVGLRGWGFWLNQYLLSYSERGQVTGLSYTDVNAQLPAYRLLVIIAAVCVVLFLLNVRYRNYLLPGAGVGILLVAAIVLSGVYPAIVQRLQVAPQELPRERGFISRNLEETRYAFGIADVVSSPFAAGSALTEPEVRDNARTMESIRLWDPATLQNTYRQLQEFRPYYDFRDVDVDRYAIEDGVQQVMISVREISERDLPSEAQTWQNERLVYTHGYGLVSSDVSTAGNDGQPVFFVRNIPPEGVEQLAIDNPRIYFGENPPEYSIVQTTEQELDFPVEGGPPATHVYEGADGVGVGGPLRRLAFGLRYGEPNFVLSNLITPDSRILFRRNIRDRVSAVAPYLELDHDPYPVAVDGRIKWIIDAYTTTDMVPYSERVDMGLLTPAERPVLETVQQADGTLVLQERLAEVPGIEGTANYIRNSVKAVIDAYDGTVTLYAVDDDPILQAWGRVFPGTVTDLEDASDDLRRHFRYPEDMFRIQSGLFRTYHIPDADEFYSKEDAWNIPRDAAHAANQQTGTAAQGTRSMRPYYLLMRLPGEESEEFALIQPFTPAERRNLIGWLAGRSDGENYGQLRAYVMPPNRTVFGPEQIQARIDQDDTVSQQITLWNQSGSRVIYGNLLVIPVGDSLLYAQPLFLRAEQSEIPELRKVVLVFGDQVVMENTLAGSLAAVFGDIAPDVQPPGDEEVAEPDDGDGAGGEAGVGTGDPRVADLIRQALERFAAAEEALRGGDLGTYQEQTAEAESLLQEADRIVQGRSAVDEPTEGATEAETDPAG
ncbi:MAG: UPF0182 family protein [Nitriliruptorales bacterium]|nr:UPF0182 family protein [Nitriliruptorales bacterium]